LCLLTADQTYRYYVLPQAEAISVTYLVRHSDGSREHINRARRDELLQAGHIKQIGPLRYKDTWKPPIFRRTATQNTTPDLASATLQTPPDESETRAYLPGQFVVIGPDKRKRLEMMETVGHMAQRLRGAVNRG